MKNIYMISYIKTPLKFTSWVFMMFILLFASCEDVLEEKPKFVVAENFYNTAGEVETAVNAIYTPFRDPWSSYTYPYVWVLECLSDYGYGRGGSSALLGNFDALTSNLEFVVSPWDPYYLAIRNANFVIKYAPKGKSISQNDINRYVAEAKFLRAFGYFMLVKNWGGVPLRTESNMDVRDLKRNTADDVYNLIVADLKEAETNLPEVVTQIGRPTKYSAKTMLADVYLNLGKYTEARDEANDVIKSNKYSLVPVTKPDDFTYNLFGPALLTTPEEIFYLKYSRQEGQGNFFSWAICHPSTKLHKSGGAYAYYSRNDDLFYTRWDDNDLRKKLWDNINFGLGPNTLVSRKFADPDALNDSGAGNDFPIYRYAEVLLIYAEASCRVANGPTTEGVEALNKVHRRAYGKDPNVASSVDFNSANYNANTFLDLILKERGYEFQFEAKRWHDLKRSGKAAQIISEYRGKTIAPACYLWPIPSSEYNYNKAIDPTKDQNPGY